MVRPLEGGKIVDGAEAEDGSPTCVMMNEKVLPAKVAGINIELMKAMDDTGQRSLEEHCLMRIRIVRQESGERWRSLRIGDDEKPAVLLFPSRNERQGLYDRDARDFKSPRQFPYLFRRAIVGAADQVHRIQAAGVYLAP